MPFYFELQTPTVELTVKPKDATGASATIIAGFKRYDIEEAAEKFDTFTEINKPLSEAEEQLANAVEEDKDSLRFLVKQTRKEVQKEVDAMLKNEIVHLRKVQLMEPTPGKPGEYKKGKLIADTRLESDDTLWKDTGAGDCLAFLLDGLLSVSVWRNALINSMFSALSNTRLGKDAETKN